MRHFLALFDKKRKAYAIEFNVEILQGSIITPAVFPGSAKGFSFYLQSWKNDPFRFFTGVFPDQAFWRRSRSLRWG